MQIKFLLPSILLIFSTFQAYSTPATEATSHPQDVCNLPPPFNFQVTEIGPDYLIASWTVANPNQGAHRVKVFRQSNNQLLKTVDVPAGQYVAMVNDLPVATNFVVTCCELCTSGEEGPPSTATSNGVILDLIVKGYQDTDKNLSNCQIDPTHFSCDLSLGFQDTYFEVVRTVGEQVARKFLVRYFQAGQNTKFEIRPAPYGQDGIKFTCPYPNDPETDCSAIPAVKIKGYLTSGEFSNIVALKCSGTSVAPKLVTLTAINSEYVVRRLDFVGHKGSNQAGTTGLDEAQVSPLENLFMSPNPFTESIDLTFYLPPSMDINAQLLTPGGQIVYAQHLDAGLSAYTLRPTNLPAGLYFLRMEAAGEVRTIKIVKSE